MPKTSEELEKIKEQNIGKWIAIKGQKKLPEDPVASIDGILEGADLGKLRVRAAERLAKHKLGLR